MRVLYVDDEYGTPMFQSKLDLLQLSGIEVVAVSSVRDLMQNIDRYTEGVEAIILDVLMPPEIYRLDETNGGTTTGFRLLRDLRLIPTLSKVPIIVVSAKRKPSDAELSRLGIDEYLEKPVLAEEIAQTLRAHRDD